MKKYKKEIERLKKKINQSNTSTYDKATEECLKDIEKLLQKKEKKIPAEVTQVFNEYVTNAKRCKEINEQEVLYIKLVERFVDIINVLGIKDLSSIFFFYKICLQNGVLSINNKFTYDKNLDITDSVPGARIVTGVANSHDISSFLTSIYKSLGFDAITIPCIITPIKCENCIIASEYARNHPNPKVIYVNIIAVDDRLVVYDPLNTTFAKEKHGDFFKMGKYGLIIDSLNDMVIDKDNRRILNEIIIDKLLPLTDESFNHLLKSTNRIYLEYSEQINVFNISNKDMISRLAAYNEPKEDSLTLKKTK